MLAIEEVCGIARIKGHRHESREGSELGARPFPAVSDEIIDAESASASRVRAHGRRIPGAKIKIAVAFGWRFVAPGIEALLVAFGRAISRAMDLRFGREFAPEPICVCRGFCVTHVDRPLLGKANLTEHGSKQPEIAFGPPEHWMLNIFFGSPGPAFGGPEPAVLIAAGLHEAQEIVVCDVMALDGERRNGHF